MEEIFRPAVPLGSIVLRTTVVYVVLLLLLRVAGKRELGQLEPFDVVVILTVANAVQNAMVGPDTSLTGGLVAAAVLIGLNYLVAAVGLRSWLFRRAFRGTPTVLVNDGEFVTPNLRREAVDPDDVLMAIREHGVESLSQVKLAVLETDGSISIVPKETPTMRTRRHVRFLTRRS